MGMGRQTPGARARVINAEIQANTLKMWFRHLL